jgi:hypothetical protein
MICGVASVVNELSSTFPKTAKDVLFVFKQQAVSPIKPRLRLLVDYPGGEMGEGTRSETVDAYNVTVDAYNVMMFRSAITDLAGWRFLRPSVTQLRTFSAWFARPVLGQ